MTDDRYGSAEGATNCASARGDYVNADHVVADYLPEALVRDIGGRAISDALDIDVAPGANRAKDLRLKKWLRVLPRLEVRP